MEYPFGNHEWQLVGENEDCLSGPMDGDPSLVTLTLNACGQQEFNCIDGQCVNITQRCDRRIDCEDKSGEPTLREKLIRS